MSSFSKSKFDLTGKFALITGAAGLLGLQHSLALLESGADIVITDINKENLVKIKDLLENQFPNSRIYEFLLDITDLSSIYKLKDNLKKQNIFINILINNAAINPSVNKDSLVEFSRFENFPNDQWENQIKVGLTGAFNCCKVFGSEMAFNKKGVIINIASDLSVIAPNQSLYEKNDLKKEDQPVKPVSYSVIKHGIIGLTKYLSTYWAKDGVRCNALSPGGIFNDQSAEFINKINKLIPMGRMANRDEYRGAIQFLCSDASSYMNGQNLIIDGGRTVM